MSSLGRQGGSSGSPSPTSRKTFAFSLKGEGGFFGRKKKVDNMNVAKSHQDDNFVKPSSTRRIIKFDGDKNNDKPSPTTITITEDDDDFYLTDDEEVLSSSPPTTSEKSTIRPSSPPKLISPVTSTNTINQLVGSVPITTTTTIVSSPSEEDVTEVKKDATFKLNDDSLLLSDPTDENTYDDRLLLHQGYLTKEGAFVHNWKKRYFKLFTNRLEYYKSPGDSTPIKSISIIPTTQVGEAPEKEGQRSFAFKVITQNRTFFLSASNKEQMMDWIKKISHAVLSVHLVKGKTTSKMGKKSPSLQKLSQDFLSSTISEKRKGGLPTSALLSTMSIEQLTNTFALNESDKTRSIEEFVKTFFECKQDLCIKSKRFINNFKESYSSLKSVIVSPSFKISSFQFIFKGICQYEKPQPFIGGFPMFMKGTYYIMMSNTHKIQWVGFKSIILGQETTILFDLNDTTKITHKSTRTNGKEDFHLSFEFDLLSQKQSSFGNSNTNQMHKLDFRFSDRNIWSFILFEFKKLINISLSEEKQTAESSEELPERTRSKSSAPLPVVSEAAKQDNSHTEEETLTDDSHSSSAFSDNEKENDGELTMKEITVERSDDTLTEKDEDMDYEETENPGTYAPIESEIIPPRRKKKEQTHDILHNIRYLERASQDDFISTFSNLYYDQYSKYSRTPRSDQEEFIVFADERVIDKIFCSFIRKRDSPQSSIEATGMLYITNHFLWFDGMDSSNHQTKSYQWMLHLNQVASIFVNLTNQMVRISLKENPNHYMYISLRGEDRFEDFSKNGFEDLITLDIHLVNSQRAKRFLSSLRILYSLAHRIQFAYNLDRQVFQFDMDIIRSIETFSTEHEHGDSLTDSDATSTDTDSSAELSLLNINLANAKDSMISDYFQKGATESFNINSETDADDTTFDGAHDDDNEEYFDVNSFELELVKKFKNRKVQLISKQNVVDESKVLEVRDMQKNVKLVDIKANEDTKVALSGKNAFTITFNSSKKIQTLKFEILKNSNHEPSYIVNTLSDFISGSLIY